MSQENGYIQQIIHLSIWLGKYIPIQGELPIDRYLQTRPPSYLETWTTIGFSTQGPEHASQRRTRMSISILQCLLLPPSYTANSQLCHRPDSEAPRRNTTTFPANRKAEFSYAPIIIRSSTLHNLLPLRKKKEEVDGLSLWPGPLPDIFQPLYMPFTVCSITYYHNKEHLCSLVPQTFKKNNNNSVLPHGPPEADGHSIAPCTFRKRNARAHLSVYSGLHEEKGLNPFTYISSQSWQQEQATFPFMGCVRLYTFLLPFITTTTTSLLLFLTSKSSWRLNTLPISGIKRNGCL